MDKPGRNDPCPCGSGKKYKRCCLAKNEAASGFTGVDRRSALDGLERFVDKELGAEEDDASAFFYREYEDRLDELDHMWIQASEEVYDMWFFCDWQLEDGHAVLDLFIERNPHLDAGERRYLKLLRETSMRVYEVEDLSPGESVTLREIPSGTKVTVCERQGSRSLWRHALVAARIISRGPSGEPEIEQGFLSIPELIGKQVESQLKLYHQEYLEANPAASETEFYKDACPFLHEAWLSSLLEPQIPKLKNTDGEDLLLTRVQFDILDPAALGSALDNAKDLDREEEGKRIWIWSGKNLKGDDVTMGNLLVKGNSLELGCNSAARAERGRAFIEALVPDAIRHRATVYENVAAAVRDRIRSQVAAGGSDAVEKLEDLPRAVQEDLALDAYARHYRKWLDEPIPALSDHTPREAARDTDLHPKLADLIRGLEGIYQRSLKEGTPAYDPSWMWTELGLTESSMPAHPPPLANERMAEIVPGFAELYETVAGQIRRRSGFDDASTVMTAEEAKTSIEIQRFLRNLRSASDPESPPLEDKLDAASLEGHVLFGTNFELHRRKTFWVDESLAYMLAKTDLDVLGSELRVPFPSFALIFTDRYTLSLAERMLSADRDSPLAGHFLKVATIYVTEERGASSRTLHLGFALVALGADPPHLMEVEIPVIEDQHVRHYLDSLAPKSILSPQTPDSNPLRGLLHLVCNAILYATSAGVEPQFRRSPGSAPERRSGRKEEPLVFSSENVYFLPGAIEISSVRALQELERVSAGRSILHRFMVRGHWRRAAASWKDQRMRWIEPYWKGPDIAAVIERTYKLKP